jgi:hypothetical protein
MILLVEPEHLIRPGMVALRGGGITLFSMLAFFSIAGIDRTQYVGAYLSAVVISFALHYFGAWYAIRTYRKQRTKTEHDALP